MPEQAYQGRVGALQQRFEQSGDGNVTVWNFRVDRWDSGGKPLPPVAVEMRGRTFSGAIANGDMVRFAGTPNGANLICPSNLVNLSSRSLVSAVLETAESLERHREIEKGKKRQARQRILGPIFFGCFALFVFFMAFANISTFRGISNSWMANRHATPSLAHELLKPPAPPPPGTVPKTINGHTVYVPAGAPAPGGGR